MKPARAEALHPDSWPEKNSTGPNGGNHDTAIPVRKSMKTALLTVDKESTRLNDAMDDI